MAEDVTDTGIFLWKSDELYFIINVRKYCLESIRVIFIREDMLTNVIKYWNHLIMLAITYQAPSYQKSLPIRSFKK